MRTKKPTTPDSLMEEMLSALKRIGVSGTQTSHGITITEDVSIEVMPDIVALGGKPYLVFAPNFASPHMDTPAQVVQYLREQRLI